MTNERTNERMNERLEEVSSHSLDITEQNIEKLKELFPEVLTEKKIDFDKLRLILGDEVETAPERYNFTWNGKKQVMQLAQQPTVATLKPNKAKSKNWDETQNLYIEGDNLEVLNILQKSYANKVKLIYLDPPYNTGHDFIYADDFSTGKKQYLDESGQIDSDGLKMTTNSEDSGRFHTNWLNMMYPRLKTARGFLRKDGVIFISIGDDEVHNLRKIMDELYGQNNFLGQVVRVAKTTSFRGNFFAPSKDYLLAYAKDINSLENFADDVDGSQFKKIEESGPRKGEKYRDDIAFYLSTLETRPNQRYFIEAPDGERLLPPGNTMPPDKPQDGDGVWRWSKDSFEKQKDLIVFKKSNRSPLINQNGERAHWNIYTKSYLADKAEKGNIPRDIFEGMLNREGSAALKKLDIPFDFPKPVSLIQKLIKITGTKGDDIVMDFFSGSGTTADAVLRSNFADGENRRFIMVQLPEQLSEKDVAFKDGYKTIPEIAEERICRAGDKIVEENPLLADKLDIGFKVFELSKSNIKKWNAEPKDLNEQFELLANNFEEGSKSIDVVYEIMLKQGLDLTYPISEIKVGDAVVYDIAFGAMFVVLGDKITSEVAGHIMKQIADEEAENSVVVLQDEKFINDSEKLNTIEQLNASGIQYNDILSI